MLVELAAFVLSDCAEGEQPELPECFEAADTTEHVVVLTQTVFKAVVMMTQHADHQAAGLLPLSLSLAKFVTRWSSTWLWLQDTGSSNAALHSYFTSDATATQLLTAILQLTEQWTCQLARAPALAAPVVSLLAALAARKVLQRQLAVREEWWRLAAGMVHELPRLPAEQIRRVVQAVLRGSSADSATTEARVWPLLLSIQQLELLCEVGRGAARASQALPAEARGRALQRAASVLPSLCAAGLEQMSGGSCKLAGRNVKLSIAVMESSSLMCISDPALTSLVGDMIGKLCATLH